MKTYKAHWRAKAEFTFPGVARKGSGHVNYRVTGVPDEMSDGVAEVLLVEFIHRNPKNKLRSLTWRKVGGVKFEREMARRRLLARQSAAKRKAAKARASR